MRRSSVKTLISLAAFSAAATLGAQEPSPLAEAERAFSSGDLAKCESSLAPLLEPGKKEKLSKEQLLRALAMKEYVDSVGGDSVEKTLKLAKDLSARSDMRAKDVLDNAAILIRRASDWKDRCLPEASDLLALTEALLAKAGGNGDPQTVLKASLLLVKCKNLNGDYGQTSELLDKLLHHYFPDALAPTGQSKPLPPLALRLLTLRGEQQLALGVRANDAKEKTARYSDAASFFLKASSRLPKNSDMAQELGARLLLCQEALRLLGYNLQLPPEINKDSLKFDPSLAMIDEMLKQRRYSDALLVLDSSVKKLQAPDSETLLRYAQALAGTGDYRAACSVISSVKLAPSCANMLFGMANGAKAARKTNEALELFKLCASAFPDSQDIATSYSECGRLLLENGSFDEAAKHFLLSAGKEGSEKAKAQTILSASQCFCKAGNCVEARKAALQAEELDGVSNESSLVVAQASFRIAEAEPGQEKKIEDAKLALERFSKLAEARNLQPDTRKSVLLLAGLAGTLAGDELAAMKFLSERIEEAPDDRDSLDAVQKLESLRLRRGEIDEAVKLASETAKVFKDDPASERMAFLAANSALARNNAKAALESYAIILNLTRPSEETLLNATSSLLSAQFDGDRPAAEKLLSDLLRKRLPASPAQPKAGELYFRGASVEMRLGNRKEALDILNAMLKESKVCHLFEAKLMHAELLRASGDIAAARRDYLDVILGAAPSSEAARKASFLMADSWRESGDLKRAISLAWKALPANARPDALDPDEREWIRRSLELIVSCAEKTGSQSDKDRASLLLNQFK